MHLVQIDTTPQKTVMELIRELADQQANEIEELKRSAQERASRRYTPAKKPPPQ